MQVAELHFRLKVSWVVVLLNMHKARVSVAWAVDGVHSLAESEPGIASGGGLHSAQFL